MTYIVTFGNHPAPGPVAIDQCKDLKSALQHACYLMSTRHHNVAISDGNGNQVSGDDLVACCEERMKLTSDLKVVPV